MREKETEEAVGLNARDPEPEDRSRKTAEQRVRGRLYQAVWEARGFFSEDEIHQQVGMTLANVRKDRL